MTRKFTDRSRDVSERRDPRPAIPIAIGLRRGGQGRNVVTTTSTADIRGSLAMKQEPEDEEDCYLDETSMPPASTTPPPPPLLPPPSSSSSSSSGRHGSVTHRVRSHARSLRAMANPSAVWAHFDLCTNDPLRAQCRICGAVVVRGGANPRQCGTTNLHRHLRVHHGGRLIGRRYHGKHPPGEHSFFRILQNFYVILQDFCIILQLFRKFLPFFNTNFLIRFSKVLRNSTSFLEFFIHMNSGNILTIRFLISIISEENL